MRVETPPRFVTNGHFKMDYQGHYKRLVERAKNREEPEITERHHIIPRSIGGLDTSENIIKLTPEEHFVTHQLLLKMYPEFSFQLTYALNMMTINSRSTRRSNKRYGWIRRRYIQECRTRKGNKNPSFGKRWYHNPETLEAGKFIQQPEGWNPGRTPKEILSHCKVCNAEVISSVYRKYCDAHRSFYQSQIKRQKKVKAKDSYSTEEKLEALKAANGNIRAALYNLGLCDSGSHYKTMRELKHRL